METVIPVDARTLLLFGFYLITLLYVIFTAILYFHWMQYALNERVRGLSLILYFGTTIPLISTIGLITLWA